MLRVSWRYSGSSRRLSFGEELDPFALCAFCLYVWLEFSMELGTPALRVSCSEGREGKGGDATGNEKRGWGS